MNSFNLQGSTKNNLLQLMNMSSHLFKSIHQLGFESFIWKFVLVDTENNPNYYNNQSEP